MKTTVFTTLIILIFSAQTFSQEWITNFEKTTQLANQQNKNILLVFSGSDWCAPCMKLEKNIWLSNEFKEYSQKLILHKADFPKRAKNKISKEQQKANNILAEKYNKQGLFPIVLVLDKNGKVLGTTGYKNISASEYITMLESFNP